MVAGYEDFERASQVRSHPCDVLDEQKEGSRGQLVVRVESSGTECFWVDETEVTVQEYETWLDQNPGFDDWDTTFCSWKSPGPSDPSRNVDDECRQTIASNESDPFGTQKPIRCVDWCDAHAFCESTGSHLCHHNNTGGSLEPEGFPSEWQKACDGRLDPDLYPWGDEPAPSEVCNINQTEMDCQATGTLSCGPTPVGQLEDCATPNGMKDPLGNVAEWVFACAKGGSAEPDGTCLAFGGGYADSRASCSSVGQVGRIKQDRFPDVGFRCCEALTTEERVRVY